VRTKLFAAVVGLALLSFSAVQSFTAPPTSVAGEPQEKSGEPSLYMRRKLRFSQEIFAGIARTDLVAVAAASRQMNALNWFEQITRGDDEEYQRHLKSYQVAGRKLQKKADAKDLDGATLAFMELTLSCVNCHKNVREHDATKPDAQSPSHGKSP
jgi:hypothetical protein